MARIIGIDLGTTNTAIAVMDQGRPRIIEDERGYRVLPSVISAKGDGRFIVGQAAHSLILSRPDRTVYGTKRLMGRRFDSPEVRDLAQRVRYALREAADGGVEVLVGDQWMTPQEVAAVILQVARSVAERALGETVEEAVITVPAYFNHAQRKATLEAAELAGLRCERLLNEPTAAALAYGHRKNVNRHIAVFDLGGGTFDVSVLHLQDGIYEILGTAGDTYLGGDDFDFRVVDFLAEQFQLRHRVDLREDREALQRLRDAAERAKCELSFSDQTNIVIPQIHGGESLEATMTRAALEAITGDLIDRCVAIARKAVQDAGLALSDVDEVLLVGGQTRMPKVREAVAGVFGRDPSRGVHPEEVVAIGASVHAASLGDESAERTVLLDVTPFDLGIDTSRGIFVPIIERNSRIPAVQTRVFATVHDQQETVRITVRQGASRVASENEFLGEFMLEGLTPAPAMQTKVDVSFRVDTNGILHVAAVERGTGERRQITIRNYAEHAKSPRLPSPEEAEADRAARARRVMEDLAARGAAAGGPGATAGAAKKVGILGRLFGVRKRAPRAAPTPTSPPTPAAVAPAVEPSSDPAADTGMGTAVPVAPAEDDTVVRTPLAEGIEETIPADGLEPLSDADLGPATELVQPADLALPAEEALYDEDFTNPRLGTPSTMDAEIERLNAELESGLDVEDLFGGGDGTATVADGSTADDPFAQSAAPSGNPFDVDEPTRPGASPFDSPPPAATVRLDDIFAGPSSPPSSPAPALDFDFTDARVGLAPRVTPIDPEPADDRTHPANPRRGEVDEPSVPDLGLAATNDESGGFALLEPVAAPPSRAEATEGRARGFDETTGGGARRRRRPARIKLAYRDFDAFVSEYRENLRRGGTFIRTPHPLTVGRECVFEISAPGLSEPLVFPAVVTFVAAGAPGQEAGMGVEYQLDDLDRRAIERVLNRT